MTTFELKKELIREIVQIEDKNFLNALKVIIETKSKPGEYITSPQQKEQITDGINQLNQGEYFTDKEIEMEIYKWLKEK